MVVLGPVTWTAKSGSSGPGGLDVALASRSRPVALFHQLVSAFSDLDDAASGDPREALLPAGAGPTHDHLVDRLELPETEVEA